MQPLDLGHQLRRQLDTFGVDAEAPVVDLACSCCNIQVAARGLRVENRAIVVFKLFKTAEAALVALCFPTPRVFLYLLFLKFSHKPLRLQTGQYRTDTSYFLV